MGDSPAASGFAPITSPHFSVGLEEGPGGESLIHCFSIAGCVAGGDTRDDALGTFTRVLAEWLHTLGGLGEPIPPPGTELAIAVDEWVRSGPEIAEGNSTACFEADLPPLTHAEIRTGLRRLGDLRGLLLSRIRRLPDAELDRPLTAGEWSIRRTLDELARAQWWTLSRLGASPMAEVPDRTLARLDTAMALVVQQFTEMPEERRGTVLDVEDETWTPRKVLRRLLWLEWSLGRAVLVALPPTEN